jgi:uncharacterized protein YndB with AHSA1/START domain
MDLKKFVKRMTVRVDLPHLYQAWATQAGLETWFLRKAEFSTPSGIVKPREATAQAGDHYWWLWHGWDDDTFERKKVIQANGKDFFQFTFSGESVVSVQLIKEKNVNLVELTQVIPDSIDADLALRINCDAGWTFYLTNLKSVLEGGLDLRHKDTRLKSIINA